MNDINAKSNTYPFVEVVIYSEIVRSICPVNQSTFSRQTLAGTHLSQITPDILLQPFHHARTLLFTYLPHFPLLCTVEPRYLKSSTFATSSPCIFTVPLTCLSYTHVFCLSPIDFHSSSLQSISPALQLLFYPFLALAADPNRQCHLQTSWSMELPL